MSQKEYQAHKHRILKIITITLAVLLSLGIVFALVYARFGLAGFAKLLGLDRQQNIVTQPLEDTEITYIKDTLGYDPVTADTGGASGTESVSLSLTPAGLHYLISSMVRTDGMLENLQVNVSESGDLMLSSIVDVDLMLKTFGESKELIDSSIGELPAQVPVYVVASLGEGENASQIDELKVGSLKIPAKLLGSINPYIDEGLVLLFANAMNISLDDIYVKDGKIELTGDFPSP